MINVLMDCYSILGGMFDIHYNILWLLRCYQGTLLHDDDILCFISTHFPVGVRSRYFCLHAQSKCKYTRLELNMETLLFLLFMLNWLIKNYFKLQVDSVIEEKMESSLKNYGEEGYDGVTRTWDIVQHEVNYVA